MIHYLTRSCTVGTLLVSVFVCGCSEPVDPSFFTGTWTPVHHTGSGDVRIDIASYEVVTQLGREHAPYRLRIEKIRSIHNGLCLTLRPLPPVADEDPGFTLDWEFTRVASDEIQLTDDAGGIGIFRRVRR